MYVPTTDQKFIIFVEIHDVSLKFQVFRTKQNVYKFRWLKAILSCSALTLFYYSIDRFDMIIIKFK